MQKYWSLDLEFLKMKGMYVPEYMLEGYSTYKSFNKYKLSNYIGSKVISKNTESEFLSRKGGPYEYLKVIRRFIIPSEVIISEKMYMYEATHRNEVLVKTKIECSMKYVVDENEMKLKPSEIIYYREEKLEPYMYFFDKTLRKINDKTLVLYDKKLEKYKCYIKYTDEERVHLTDLSGTEAKKEIENRVFRTYPVTSVENVEQVVT